MFALGLYGYRRAGRELGEHLSPLVAPREPAALVEDGPYRSVRHPMYRAEILMAFGVPILLAAPLAALLAAWFALTVLRRIAVEETVLAERLPAYRPYAGRTARLVRRVY